MIRGLILFIFLFVIHNFTQAQYYNTGQNPASVKWRKIQSEHFKLIYPHSFEEKANILIGTLEESYTKTTRSLSHSPKTIPVILNIYNSESNGITFWAPKRIEFYTIPPQDNYAQDWLTQLSIHEYRHVVQLDKTNQGFTKFLSRILGEQANAAIIGLFVPQWFLEGDAVCAETAFSNSGRGRLPSFEMPMRAQVIQHGVYPYFKAALGSYNTRVPNHYELGYQFVASIRQKYGIAAWNSALNTVARKPYTLAPFNIGLKRVTQKTKEELYNETLEDLRNKWIKQDSLNIKTNYKVLSLASAKFEKYLHPVYLTDSHIIALHTSPDFISYFALVQDSTNPQKVFTPGYINSETFTISKLDKINKTSSSNKVLQYERVILCWSEHTQDLRWEMQSYSDIMLFDTYNQKLKRLTQKKRYFSPAISYDGTMVCAVKITPENESSIVVLDTELGMEKKTLITSQIDNFQTPRWSNDCEKIVYVRLSGEGKCIEELNIYTGKTEQLLEPTFIEISNPTYAKGFILFNGSYSGIENVYAIEIDSKKVFQVTSSAFGARNAALNPSQNKITYSDYDASGYRVVETDFEPTSWKAQNPTNQKTFDLAEFITKEENLLSKTIPKDSSVSYKSERYKKGLHLFNFHSWSPAYFNYTSSEYGPGITLISQNTLSTATTLIGYKYDIAEESGKAIFEFNWEGWYPKFFLNTSTGSRTAFTQGDTSTKYTFNESIANFGATVPFRFTAGKYNKSIQLSISQSFYSIWNSTSNESNLLKGTIQSFNYQALAYRLIKQSSKDMYPRWGNVLILNYKHTPWGDNNLGNIFAIETRNFFPGLMRNHGLRVDLRYQIKKAGDYSYNNLINLPRGYLIRNFSELIVAAINYKFPLTYPDWTVGKVLYIKRIKTNAFVDFGYGYINKNDTNLFSFGTELSSDLHFFGFLFPFEVGYRFGYRPIEGTLFGNFLFSLNLPS